MGVNAVMRDRAFRSFLAGMTTFLSASILFGLSISTGMLLRHLLSPQGVDDFDPYIWGGFLIGLVLAAFVILAGMFFMVKPWLTRSPMQGHCTACGYNLRGLGDEAPRCPECGKPISEV